MPRTIRRNESSPRGGSGGSTGTSTSGCSSSSSSSSYCRQFQQTTNSTPDMDVIKNEFNTAINSPHLLDHGYGATPQNQLMNNQITYYNSNINAIAPVKRKLNLDSHRQYIVPIKQEFKTPPAKKPKRNSNNINNNTPIKKNTRYDTSLGLLTKKFSALLESSPNGVVDLNKASQTLKVQKRRIYDITNVLEGIGILEKKSKNNIQWRGGCNTNNSTYLTLKKEVEDLENQENNLNKLICSAESELIRLNNDRHGYVTYHDLRSIERLKDNTVIVVKAPPNTELTVPEIPDHEDKYNIQMHSTTKPIEVFLCPDYVPPKVIPPIDPLLKDIKFSPGFDLTTTPPVPLLDSPTTNATTSIANRKPISSEICRNLSFSNKNDPVISNNNPTSILLENSIGCYNNSSSSNNETIAGGSSVVPIVEGPSCSSNNVLDSFKMSPLFSGYTSSMDNSKFITDNYNQQIGNTTQTGMDPFFCSEPFLPLEPLTQSEYNFSMDPSEGLADLFDLFDKKPFDF